MPSPLARSACGLNGAATLSPAALVMPAAALTLLLTTAVAALPALLASGQAPRTPATSRERLPAAGAPGATEATPPLLLARSGRGVWFLRGQPIAAAALARLLADGTTTGRSAGEVVLLAGADLSLAEVSASLQWLRRHSRRPVRLETGL